MDKTKKMVKDALLKKFNEVRIDMDGFVTAYGRGPRDEDDAWYVVGWVDDIVVRIERSGPDAAYVWV